MHRSRLLLGIASVLAGTTVVLVVAGLWTNPLLLVLALPVAASAAVLWADATDRLTVSVGRQRTRRSRDRTRQRSRRSPAERNHGTVAERRARRVLGVDEGADDEAIRRAFRDRAKELHPDTDGGSEAAFKRLADAYDTLRD